MKKLYHLSSCSTCKRIIKELNLQESGFVFQDIKTEKITGLELEQLKSLAGSYEALFSRTAMKYKVLGLNEKQLTEDDYKNYILDEYTFLKRPVILIDEEVFIGNAKKTIEQVRERINEA